MDGKNTDFSGFSQDTLDFLASLGIYNSKAWYESHREEYRQFVLEPFKALVAALSQCMLEIDPHLEVTPAVDKTISRIYRDTRFSKDKSPYRSNVWISFKRTVMDWKEAPCYYFEITPVSYRYGMGFYTAPKAVMDRFRQRLDAKPGAFLDAVSFLKESGTFTLEGDKYKKALGTGKNPEIADWYQYKSLHLVHNSRIDERLFSAGLAGDLKKGFKLLEPLYYYLWETVLEAEDYKGA